MIMLHMISHKGNLKDWVLQYSYMYKMKMPVWCDRGTKTIKNMQI